MSTEIRPARFADAPVLAQLDGSVNPSPWTLERFERLCATDSASRERVLVAEHNDGINGFIALSQVLDEASIHMVAVAGQAQGRGLGSVLVSAALACARQAGARRCLLEVRRSNAIARRLYESHGFVLDGVRKNYYPDGEAREDALLMSRSLQESVNERT